MVRLVGKLDRTRRLDLRILLINTLYAPYAMGGAEQSVAELAEELAASGHEVCVMTLMDASSDLPASDCIRGVRVERVMFGRAWPFGKEWVALSNLKKSAWHLAEDISGHGRTRVREVVRDFAPHIINTHNIAGFGTAIWDEAGSIPVIHTIRDYYLTCIRTTRYRGDHICERTCGDCLLLTSLRRRRLDKPLAFIGVSHRVLQIHEEAGLLREDQPCFVVYNSPRTSSELTLPSAETTRFTDGFRYIFGFMGRLEHAKGLPIILDAMKSPELSDIGLVVAGSGRADHVDNIRRHASEHPNVHYAGRIPAEVYRSMINAALVPTQWEEPFGRVALEARAAQLPIIASPLGGLPEVLSGYEPAVLVDDPRQVEQWIEAMKQVALTGPHCTKETDAGFINAEPVLNVGQQYQEVYESVMTKAGSAN